ncbi:hypothetical protein [Jiangella ureilytica]|uniref:hypothetical protein n=1 Tax=Jiangella ureilytica TaxID=2530374 RepID=UPI0013A5D1E3|nr:hypothetical protein [Jiangella ureilytica]
MTNGGPAGQPGAGWAADLPECGAAIQAEACERAGGGERVEGGLGTSARRTRSAMSL